MQKTLIQHFMQSYVFIIQFSNEEGVNWIFDVDFKATYLTLASENFLPIMNNKLQIVQL